MSEEFLDVPGNTADPNWSAGYLCGKRDGIKRALRQLRRHMEIRVLEEYSVPLGRVMAQLDEEIKPQ